MKKTALATLVLATTLSTGSLLAGDHRPYFGGGHFMPLKIVKTLDLSNEQEDKIESIMKDHWGSRGRRGGDSDDRQKRRLERTKNVQGFFKEESFDKKGFIAYGKKGMQERIENGADLIEDTLEVLTPKQTKEFYARMSTWDKYQEKNFYGRFMHKF